MRIRKSISFFAPSYDYDCQEIVNSFSDQLAGTETDLQSSQTIPPINGKCNQRTLFCNEPLGLVRLPLVDNYPCYSLFLLVHSYFSQYKLYKSSPRRIQTWQKATISKITVSLQNHQFQIPTPTPQGIQPLLKIIFPTSRSQSCHQAKQAHRTFLLPIRMKESHFQLITIQRIKLIS